MLIEKIAKELGLELKQEFTIAGDKNIYKFTKDGLEDKYGRQDHVLSDIICEKINKEDIKPLKWKPKRGETYYAIELAEVVSQWDDTGIDIYRYRRGLICESYEEARELKEYLYEQTKKFQKSRKK